jgi:peptidoglycan L-alanyl-D-glutamate endopeptidase CwlK
VETQNPAIHAQQFAENMNPISQSRLSLVHPELSRRIIQMSQMLDFDFEVTQGLRTWTEQDALYAQGRTTSGPIVTNAAGGYSAHNFGYAVDLVPEDITPGQPNWNVAHPAWQKMFAAGKSVGLAEGAEWRTFPDNPHFYLPEFPATPTDEMRQTFTEAGMEAVWKEAGL